MHTAMPIGIDDFAKIRESYYFVDKTETIGKLIESPAEVTLFTRPRRFGKTLLMSMFRYFFDIEGAAEHRKLFDGLKVAEQPDVMAQQGTRPVLFLTLKDWKSTSWTQLQRRIQLRIGDLFSAYDFLLEDDLKARDRISFQQILDEEADLALLSDSLLFLLRLMEIHYGRKPVLLLDEYDVPVQTAWECGYYQEAIGFFREFLTAALKTNASLDFAVLTGVLRISKESIFSDLNNLFVDSVLNPYYLDAFGFTEAEVEKMAADLGYPDKMQEIREWYDGYRMGEQEIYNPWSVISYFKRNCVPDTYWVNTSGNVILGELLKRLDQAHMDNLEMLLQGGSVKGYLRDGIIYDDIRDDETALYTMLCTTGYLTVESVRRIGRTTEYLLRLPNSEIQALFGVEILKRFSRSSNPSALVSLMESILAGDVERVQEGLSDFLEVLASTFDTAKGKESFYHGFVLGLTALLVPDYEVRSNRESGRGRYDVAVFPKKAENPGVVLEFKTAGSAEELAAKAQEALEQIAARGYDAEFRARGVTDVKQYGIAFCGKQAHVLLRA